MTTKMTTMKAAVTEVAGEVVEVVVFVAVVDAAAVVFVEGEASEVVAVATRGEEGKGLFCELYTSVCNDLRHI